MSIDRRIRAAGFHERVEGIGDTVLMFKWQALRPDISKDEEGDDPDWLRDEPAFSLRLEAGAALPTGSTRKPQIMAGTPVSLLQTGSGTVQPIVGAGLRLDWGGMAGTIDMRSRLPFYENGNDFQEGVSFVASLGWEIWPTEDLMLRAGLDVDWRKRDLQFGSRIEPGGGVHLSIHPAILWSPTDSIQVFGGVIVPVYRKVPNRTLDPALTVELGVSFTF